MGNFNKYSGIIWKTLFNKTVLAKYFSHGKYVSKQGFYFFIYNEIILKKKSFSMVFIPNNLVNLHSY